MLRFQRVYRLENDIDELINMFTLSENSDEDFVDAAREIKMRSRGKIKEIKRLYNDEAFILTTNKGTMKVYMMRVSEDFI